MGGGAGITIRLAVSTAEAIWSGNAQLADLTPPTIESFDMIGYQDGMSNIAGDLLTVASFSVSPVSLADAHSIGNAYELGETLPIYLTKHHPAPTTSIWNGWLRGDIRAVFPVTFAYGAQIETDGDIDVECTLIVMAAHGFYNFYRQVFQDCTQTEHTWRRLERLYSACPVRPALQR